MMDITDRRDDITLDQDHIGLKDTFASRRYFKKFETITGHLARVAGQMQAEGQLSKREVEVMTRYVVAIGYTFKALSMKYLLVGRDTGRFFWRAGNGPGRERVSGVQRVVGDGQ
jgi:hypothetical protein